MIYALLKPVSCIRNMLYLISSSKKNLFYSVAFFFSLFISTNLYSQKINIDVKNKAVQQVFKVFENQSSYSFIYAKTQIEKLKPIDFKVVNIDIVEALDLLFKNLGLGYTISGKNIIIKEKVASNSIIERPNKSFVVTGQVIDEKGKPLDGASVILVATNKGTQADKDGFFSITIPANGGTLFFSFVSFEPTTIKVSKATELKVVLKPQSEIKADEVVVVGYGTVRKSDLTGAVSQLKSEGVSEKPIMSVEQLIQGRVSGVQIQSGSGAPGAGFSIVLRGGNSTSNNQPLYVIDGYPVEVGNGDLQTGGNNQAVATPPTNPLANLNPNEIENIEILKDASSTAIYGSRGANGVILITTKRGKKGGERVEFNCRTDVANVRKTLPVLGTNDFLNYAKEMGSIDTTSIAKNLFIDHNWQDEIFQQAISNDYQLGISGGEGKTNYAIIGNYAKTNGIVRNSNFERGGIRVNIDREVSSKFKIGVNVNASKSRSKLGVNGISTGLNSSSVIASALYAKPFIQPFNSNGDIDQTIDANPFTLTDLLKDVYGNTLFFTNMTGIYQANKYLSVKANAGANFSQSLRQTYYPRGTYVGTLSNGYAYQNQDSRFNYLGELTINYNRRFGESNVNAVFGHTYQKWFVDGLAAQATNFPSDNLGYYSFQMAQAYGQTFTSHQEWSLASFLGRVVYSLKDKYLLTLTGRQDAASRLAPGHKSAFFPSAAVGWNINKEAFVQKIKWLSTLKVRASYGLSGNQTVSIGATDQFLTNDAAVIGGVLTRGYILNNIGNPNLGWENTRQINLGAEIGILKNRISIEVNLYKKNTNDLLITLPITGVSGFSNLVTNAGAVENKGIEFDFKARVLQQKFKWNFSANLSINRNKMVDMGPLGDTGKIFGSTFLNSGGLLSQPIHVTSLGNAIGSFYGYQINGIYQNATEVANGPESASAKPGDFKFVDINGDGKITASDRAIIGNPNPKFIMGINNDFEFKGFTLAVFIQCTYGNKIANLNRYRLDALTGTLNNVSKTAFDGRWTGEGTSNYYPRARLNGGYFNSRFSNFLLEDGSFVRLKNVTLGYNIPLGKVKVVKNARVFVTATNLVTITKYTGYDPEVNTNYNNPLTPGVDNGTYPQSKTFSAGINVRF